MVSALSDLEAGRHGLGDRLALPDEILADRLGLPECLDFAGLIHQVVVDAHPLADAVLGDLGLADVQAGVGGGADGQRLGLVALDQVALAGGTLHRPVESGGEAVDGVPLQVDIAFHVVEGVFEDLVSLVGVDSDDPVGLADRLGDLEVGLLLGDAPAGLEVVDRGLAFVGAHIVRLLIAIAEDIDLPNDDLFAVLPDNAGERPLGDVLADLFEQLLPGLAAGPHVLDEGESAAGLRGVRRERHGLLEQELGGVELVVFQGHLGLGDQVFDSDLVLPGGVGQGAVGLEQGGPVAGRLPLPVNAREEEVFWILLGNLLGVGDLDFVAEDGAGEGVADRGRALVELADDQRRGVAAEGRHLRGEDILDAGAEAEVFGVEDRLGHVLLQTLDEILEAGGADADGLAAGGGDEAVQVLGVEAVAEGHGVEGDLLRDHRRAEGGAGVAVDRLGHALAVTEIDEDASAAVLHLVARQTLVDGLLQVHRAEGDFLPEQDEGVADALAGLEAAGQILRLDVGRPDRHAVVGPEVLAHLLGDLTGHRQRAERLAGGGVDHDEVIDRLDGGVGQLGLDLEGDELFAANRLVEEDGLLGEGIRLEFGGELRLLDDGCDRLRGVFGLGRRSLAGAGFAPDRRASDDGSDSEDTPDRREPLDSYHVTSYPPVAKELRSTGLGALSGVPYP